MSTFIRRIHDILTDFMIESSYNYLNLVERAKSLFQLYAFDLQTRVTKISEELALDGDLCTSFYLANVFCELGVVDDKSLPGFLKECVIFRQHLWERLHSVHWSQTPIVYRELYAFATLFLVAVSIVQQSKVEIQCLQKTLDLGLLLGAGSVREGLNELINLLSAQQTSDLPAVLPPLVSRKLHYPLPTPLPPKAQVIPIHHNISIVEFYVQFFISQCPVLLSDMVDDWPALSSSDHCWQDINYLLKVAGHRTVPIETGSSYTSDGAGTSLMSISEFIHQHILLSAASADSIGLSSRPQGYLAQHELFEQIPQLKQDIMIPDLCSLLQDDDVELSDVVIQAWFGPLGTVSPLHYDSSYNLLVQVAGYKYVRLYHEKETYKLYPLTTDRMKNNSQVDLLSGFEELQQSFPLVHEAEYSEIMLRPGDMLFIPRWHWHFITSVDHVIAKRWEQEHLGMERAKSYVDSTANCCHSFSVSFWWNKKEK